MCLFSPKEAVSSGRLVLVNGHQPNHLLNSDVYSFTFLSVVIALASREVLVVSSYWLAWTVEPTNQKPTSLIIERFHPLVGFQIKPRKGHELHVALQLLEAWLPLLFFSLDLFPSNPNITWVALCWSTNNEAEKLGRKRKKKKKSEMNQWP